MIFSLQKNSGYSFKIEDTDLLKKLVEVEGREGVVSARREKLRLDQ